MWFDRFVSIAARELQKLTKQVLDIFLCTLSFNRKYFAYLAHFWKTFIRLWIAIKMSFSKMYPRGLVGLLV